MKKLLLLLILPLFFACSDKDEVEPKQDYTSVVLFTRVQLYNCKLAIKKDGVYKEVANLGTPKMHENTDEVVIPNDTDKVYVFFESAGGVMRTGGDTMKPKTRNVITLLAGQYERIKVDDPNDPTQYPQ